MLQYTDEELEGKGGYDLIHPGDCDYYSAAHQERTSCCRGNRIFVYISQSHRVQKTPLCFGGLLGLGLYWGFRIFFI